MQNNSVAHDVCKCYLLARSLNSLSPFLCNDNPTTFLDIDHHSTQDLHQQHFHFKSPNPHVKAHPHPRFSNVPLASLLLIPLTPSALTCVPFLSLCNPTATFQLSSSVITNTYFFPS